MERNPNFNLNLKTHQFACMVEFVLTWVFIGVFTFSDLWWKGVEKLIASKMMLPGSNRRIHAVHRHSGMVSFFSSFYSTHIYTHLYGNFILNFANSCLFISKILRGSYMTIRLTGNNNIDGICALLLISDLPMTSYYREGFEFIFSSRTTFVVAINGTGSSSICS